MEKGREDGLYVSSVASSTNLWAVVMDAGTGFASQVYELSPIFLHKVDFVKTRGMDSIDYLIVKCAAPISILLFFFRLDPGVDNGAVG